MASGKCAVPSLLTEDTATGNRFVRQATDKASKVSRKLDLTLDKKDETVMRAQIANIFTLVKLGKPAASRHSFLLFLPTWLARRRQRRGRCDRVEALSVQGQHASHQPSTV